MKHTVLEQFSVNCQNKIMKRDWWHDKWHRMSSTVKASKSVTNVKTSWEKSNICKQNLPSSVWVYWTFNFSRLSAIESGIHVNIWWLKCINQVELGVLNVDKILIRHKLSHYLIKQVAIQLVGQTKLKPKSRGKGSASNLYTGVLIKTHTYHQGIWGGVTVSRKIRNVN